MLQDQEGIIPVWLTRGLVPSVAVPLPLLPIFVPSTALLALLHCPWQMGTFACGALNHFHAQGLSPGQGESPYHGYILLCNYGQGPSLPEGLPY